ncbi:alpha/beta hydrolase [Streptomyces aidingensis]|uniref:TAP-like protein n=1 Tax=Streptomyces aidingensis TaxID=910347 RepID=A0A1I1MZ65_9ACTN|nr:alpha/beta hydrolase [Streptomyces aidingensis]SFC90677.1 TAP-like protein [Streptomyces aidingensis]
MLPRARFRGFTLARVAALALITLTALGLGVLAQRDESRPAVPAGAKAGDLALEPCTYDTEDGGLPADCGTLVVPENRRDPDSRLIALPVVRIHATGDGEPSEPVFRLEGGPGLTNMTFPAASRLTGRHDVVLVGYRGVDGSTVLDCPEVVSAMQGRADLVAEDSLRAYGKAFADCAGRLTAEGVDLDGYSLPQRVDDLEAARRALGYERIDLVSESAGTRTAMIYSWRYPESVHRSAMIAVNPPGHFVWDPEITDQQLAEYAELCRADRECAARTDDLAATLRATAQDVPGRWGPLAIKEGNVRAAALWGLFHTTEAAAPLNAPATLDAWLAAADGDAGGLWAVSLLADLTFPESFVWGEFAASGAIDAEAAKAYYAGGGDPGSILGNAATDFLWGGGRLAEAWPAGPDHAEYQRVRTSETETLLIGGTLDLSTPARLAAGELLPALPNGRQVLLDGLGHSTDFWHHRPEAAERLLTAFFDSGEIDDSLFGTHRVRFTAGATALPTLAKALLGTLAGLVLAAAALLGWMALRVRRRGGFGPRAGVWLRTLAPVLTGLGGWCLAVLLVSVLRPEVFIGSRVLAVVSVGAAVGVTVHWAAARRGGPAGGRYAVLAVACLGSFAGAWLGFAAGQGLGALLTTLAGAALAANLAVLVLDILRDRRAGAAAA